MANPTHHIITSMSLDNDGWIMMADHLDKSGRREHDSQPILTWSCRRLLRETKLKISSDQLNENSWSNPKGRETENDPDVTPLEQLSYRPNLPNAIVKVIADIRRLGAPSDGELRRKEGRAKGGKNPRIKKRGREGKVARLEEQRRLRQHQKQQKQEQPNIGTQHDNDESLPDNGPNDDGKERPGDEEAIVMLEKTSYPNHAEDLQIPVDVRLAAVFNSFRILIALLRPMLDHPRRKDLKLKMVNGPSINREGRAHQFYFFSKHVYTCVSRGCWNEVTREYVNLLDELHVGLPAKMSSLNDYGHYQLNAVDWIMPFFNHTFFTNPELVAEKCMGILTLNPKIASNCHDWLVGRFEKEHDKKQSMLHRSIERLQGKLISAISRRFKVVRLTVYGSCLSGLALEGSHDVDVSVFVPELDRLKQLFDSGKLSAEEYEKKMRKTIYQVRDSLEYSQKRSFRDLLAVAGARVPVVKGKDIYAQNPYSQDGSLSFDLCFLNDIAVVNSSLLREYSLFDNRVRILMLSVKSFAKNNGLASAADGTLSSYSWLNMVIFYLQCIGFLPVLQCPKMMREHDFEPDPIGNPLHCVDGLETFYLTQEIVEQKGIWEQSSHIKDRNTAMLLYGFFNFYSAVFPWQTVAASIRCGNCTLQKTSLHQTSKWWRLSLEDPFETCCSHCPHDLGCHVKDDGQKRINEHLSKARKGMAALMQQTWASHDEISIFLSWLLGPMPKSNAIFGKASALQTKNHQEKSCGNVARYKIRNLGQAKQQNINTQQKQSDVEVSNAVKSDNDAFDHKGNVTNKHGVCNYNMSARFQMNGGRVGKNGQPVHTQKKNGPRGNQHKTNHSNGHTNGAQPSQQQILQKKEPEASGLDHGKGRKYVSPVYTQKKNEPKGKHRRKIPGIAQSNANGAQSSYQQNLQSNKAALEQYCITKHKEKLRQRHEIKKRQGTHSKKEKNRGKSGKDAAVAKEVNKQVSIGCKAHGS